jgi:hypothetical protein
MISTKNLTATHANFTHQLIVASKRGVLNAQLITDNIAHLFSVSEGAQDVDPAVVRKESFKVINGSNAKGVRAEIQTYCCVNITALKLQRNKDFQFIVESYSQGGQQNDPVVGVNPKTLLIYLIFGEECRTFCEEELTQHVDANDDDSVAQQLTRIFDDDSNDAIARDSLALAKLALLASLATMILSITLASLATLTSFATMISSITLASLATLASFVALISLITLAPLATLASLSALSAS